MICPEQERLLAEEANAWLAHKVMETHNPNSPDLTELANRAGAASHQLRLHVDTPCVAERKTLTCLWLYRIPNGVLTSGAK